MHIDIRPATRTDLPAILTLYAQPAMDGDQVLALAAAEALFERMRAYPDYTVYVAENTTGIVGTYAMLIMDNLGHRGTPSAVVEDVVVAKDDQSQGIGRQMMTHAMNTARSKGCYKLTLSSNLKRDKAHAFYESLDFERHGYSFRVRFEGDPKG